MTQPVVSQDVLHEIKAALQHLSLHVIKDETNIDEICALINKADLEGDQWSFIHSYPSADEDDMILLLSAIAGNEMIITIPADQFTSRT